MHWATSPLYALSHMPKYVAGRHVRFFSVTVVDFKKFTRYKVYVTPVLRTHLIWEVFTTLFSNSYNEA